MRSLTIFDALRGAARPEKMLQQVPQSAGWWKIISEPFTGSWQRNLSEKRGDLICYPTLFACLNRISSDIGKLPFRLMAQDSQGIWIETTVAAYSPVLRKPNHFQTAQQFRESWMLSKLSNGNTYALKVRDERGVVVKLYILDPCRVKPLVAESGDVFYELWLGDTSSYLNLLPLDESGTLTVPQREVIHDRAMTIHHPLVGLPPLCAAYWPAVKNLKILRSAAEFFGNNAQPGGILSAPGAIGDQTAKRLEEYWNANFTGDKAGKVAVVGDGLKFESLAAKSVDAQMIEQLRYSDQQICQPFGIPPFKVGIGTIPAGMKVDDLNQLYYSDALQAHIEAMEALLDEGLGITKSSDGRALGVEMDLEPLLRMDPAKQAEVETKLVGGTIKSPNEGRRRFGLGPKVGGDALYLQQQNYSLEALAKRDAQADPFSTGEPPEEDEETLSDEEMDDAMDEATDEA